MPIYRLGTRYSRWDGSQQVNPLDADDLMAAMSDDLLQDGDLNRALQRLFRWGFDRQDGDHVPGLRELTERLRERRQQQLSRYDLGAMLSEIQQRLDDIVATERQGIERRLEEARRRAGAPEDDATSEGEEPSAQRGDSPSGDLGAEQVAGSRQPRGERPGPAAGESGGPEGAVGEGSGEPLDPDLLRMMEQMSARKLDQLDNLPADPGDRIRSLNDYEFMTPEAHQQFQELLAMLQQQILQQTFQGMQQALGQMTPENLAETRQMMSDLNEMLEAAQRGEDPGFQQFMHKWGHYFGNDVSSLDELMERMQRQMTGMRELMESMSAEQRGALQSMVDALTQDQGIQQQMQRLGENLGRMLPPDQWRNRFQFSGDESMTLSEALRMMDRLRDYDDMEEQLKAVRDWSDLAAIDDDAFRDLLGEEEHEQMEQLRGLTKMLEEAGYVRKTRRGWELTPQGVRKIGEKALTDIFADLKRDRMGQHDLRRDGGAGDRTDVTKPYEWGDPFLLDIPQTIMNAVQREGTASGEGVRLQPRDFEVYRTEYATRSSTVLMVDMSRSMLYNGCFNAAKRVALALDSLIRGKFPRDTLHIIGFSYMAEEIKPSDLPSLDWNEYNYGTNMQHGFQLARQILGREKGTNRQIIVITDGEPTAHFEQGHVRFSYPPTPRTFQETLREVVRCTRDQITINTFMLERSPYMVQFINDLSRINGGRVFVATPDRLGEYILVDYVANKRKWVG